MAELSVSTAKGDDKHACVTPSPQSKRKFVNEETSLNGVDEDECIDVNGRKKHCDVSVNMMEDDSSIDVIDEEEYVKKGECVNFIVIKAIIFPLVLILIAWNKHNES